jgi:putative transposase
MENIVALLASLEPCLDRTTIRQLSRIVQALVEMTGRVTMLGISRWTGKGGSYRTIQRFFSAAMPWDELFWLFFCLHVHRPAEDYVLAGDEVIIKKAGKATYGVDRFFSSIYGKKVGAVAFFNLSLVSIQARRAYPLSVKQVHGNQACGERQAQKADRKAAPKPAVKRKPGRPKAGKNKNKAAVTLTPELLNIQNLVAGLMKRAAGVVPLVYLLLDGHWGNHMAVQMAQGCGLQLISKLRSNAALYLPYTGPYAGRGPRKKYGDRLDYRNLPEQYLTSTAVEDKIETRIYQMQALHRDFCQPLNVVVIVKINRQSAAFAHVVLFSSDLTLAHDKIVDYYGLRFQIEFDFRDAKQFWGMDDFMNVSQTAVTNAVSLSLFMVLVSARLLRGLRSSHPHASVLDLKAFYRGHKYAYETIKLLPQNPDPVLLSRILIHIAQLGAVHKFSPPSEPL